MFKPPRLRSVILLGRKLGAARALEFLLKKGIGVKLVVAPKDEPYNPTFSSTLAKVARRHHIPVFFDDVGVYRLIARNDPLVRDVDLVISYLYWRRILEPLINRGYRGCINFHPAPLPDYKSRAGYNTAILEGRKKFGVSVHFIDSEKFDSGPIIKTLYFPMDPEKDTVFSLMAKTNAKLFELFKETIELFIKKERIPTRPNRGGLYLTGDQLEKTKAVNLRRDSLAVIDRKIRAFFSPPYSGAHITVRGKKYTLLNEEMLKVAAGLIAKSQDD